MSTQTKFCRSHEREGGREIKGTLYNIQGAIFNVCTERSNRIEFSDKSRVYFCSVGFEWLFKGAFTFYSSS
jgi:hypothetical protein